MKNRCYVNGKWHKRFISLAYFISMFSSDESTHIGAVIVGPDKEIISTGYNGLPRGVDYFLGVQERPLKYFYFEHAERNAIYNATLIGAKVKGTVMYTQGIPCADCARGVIQSGIKEIIVHEQWVDNSTVLPESVEHGKKMLIDRGISIRYYNGKIIREISGLHKGEIF